jgi:hypothetical protein
VALAAEGRRWRPPAGRQRRIAYVKLGRHVRITADDLDAFIAAGRVDVGELPAMRRGA